MVKAFKPAMLAEALAIRSLHDTLLFNGGTDLMVKHRSWSGTLPAFPADVLFIGDLAELQTIEVGKRQITIGSAATLTQIVAHPGIPAYIKLPIAQMASPAIRNRGTLGGNICNASSAGDSLPMLYALDAELTIASEHSEKVMLISDFITGSKETRLQQDEIVTQITIPIAAYNKYYYRKVGARKANAISKVSFYALAKQAGAEIQDVRIAFGGVAPTVIRNEAGESLLESIDRSGLPAIAQAMADFYGKLINPAEDARSTKAYRRKVSLQLLEDFIVKELAEL